MATALKNCVVTGVNGFVGRSLRARLEAHGWRVQGWSRVPQSSGEAEFHLGQPVEARRWDGVQALVHCAYDFGPRTWDEIEAVNLEGTRKLLASARAAGVLNMVVLSSISAFEGCRSMYGRVKLGIEQVARAKSAHILRPGLIYGGGRGGLFTVLAELALHRKVVPILAGCPNQQYLVHIDDLAAAVFACLGGKVAAGVGPITVACETPVTLRDMLFSLAQARGRRLRFVPVPWHLALAGLKTAEALGLKPRFRSDSLVGLVHQDPRPSFESLRALGVNTRPFDPEAALKALDPQSGG